MEASFLLLVSEGLFWCLVFDACWSWLNSLISAPRRSAGCICDLAALTPSASTRRCRSAAFVSACRSPQRSATPRPTPRTKTYIKTFGVHRPGPACTKRLSTAMPLHSIFAGNALVHHSASATYAPGGASDGPCHQVSCSVTYRQGVFRRSMTHVRWLLD
jgi:hypothetical protein